jgi:hypothetical protein
MLLMQLLEKIMVIGLLALRKLSACCTLYLLTTKSFDVLFCPCCITLRTSISFESLGKIFAGSFTSWERCSIDKNIIKLYSEDNNMDPKPSPPEISDLTVIERQLISRIEPCIYVHLLNHGGIGSSGHCVTFPQEVNEPAKIVPRFPKN